MLFKRRKVDEGEVSRILYDFLYPNQLSLNMIICYEITHHGDVIIRTNHPSLLIGKQGADIDKLQHDMRTKANVRKIKLFELHKCLVSGWQDGLQLY